MRLCGTPGTVEGGWKWILMKHILDLKHKAVSCNTKLHQIRMEAVEKDLAAFGQVDIVCLMEAASFDAKRPRWNKLS